MAHQQTYLQVRDVIERIRGAHQRLRDALEEPRPYTTDSRARLILEFLRREEQELQMSLGALLRRDESAEILDTWLQYIHDAELFQTLDAIKFQQEMSADEIAARKQEFDRELIILLRQLRETTALSRVREFFAGLEGEIDSRIKRTSWKLREYQGDEQPPQPGR